MCRFDYKKQVFQFLRRGESKPTTGMEIETHVYCNHSHVVSRKFLQVDLMRTDIPCIVYGELLLCIKEYVINK